MSHQLSVVPAVLAFGAMLAAACTMPAVADPVRSQSPLLRPDNVQLTIVKARAYVQRLELPTRARTEPSVQLDSTGRGCKFNIGGPPSPDEDIAPAKPQPARDALRRSDTTTIVEASPICIVR